MASGKTRTVFETYFNDAGSGKFKDGQAAGAITEAVDRDRNTVIKESSLFFEDLVAIEATGTDAYTITIPQVGSVGAEYAVRWVHFENTNTATCTLAVNGGAAKPIRKGVSTGLIAGDLIGGSNKIYCLNYDGTNFQVLNVHLSASETVSGIAEVATQTETNTGTDDVRIVTPLKLKTYIDVRTSAVVSVSSAEVLNMFTSPKTLIAAPGANLVIIPIEVNVFLDYNSVAYATNTTLVYQLGGATISNQLPNVLLATADYIGSFGAQIWEGPTSAAANAALTLKVNTGDPTAGNSPLKVFVTYRVISIA